MADNMECETCGGTDFYKESGYFFCNECQTQSQEVREHVFEVEAINVKSAKKIKKDKTSKKDNQVTSWECYNIVMFSLTEQLINLGAGKNLKSIVKCLWIRYLQKLEVFDLKKNTKPKLQLVNSKRDSDIINGVLPKKKRKRNKSSDESSTSLDTTSSTRRERSKKKRALVQAHYEELSQQTNQETNSLQNETLTSLKSSDKSETSYDSVRFNRYANKELKKLGYNRWIKSKFIRENNLQCSTIHEDCSREYQKGIYYLSPIKLYCILYLGLLINRDEIQLGDLFRYIREGHVAFNNYTKLFPDQYADKFLNIQNNIKNNLFSNSCFRKTSAEMAIFLNITKYIKTVDLNELCRRYCTEMNLPDEIYMAAKNILSKTKPQLKFTNKSKTIPNYEGRVMSIIFFILKLMFGLDGVTEGEMSNYAQCINELNTGKPKMFNIVSWMEYIGYRSLLIREHHFPSAYLRNSEEIDSDLFLQFIKSQGTEPDEHVKLTREMSSYRDVLMQIKDNNDDCIKFRPSLTPFLDYSRMLNSPKYDLNCSFQGDSLDYLLRPNKYLLLAMDSLNVKHRGANDNWVMEDIKSYRKLKFISRENLKLIPIKISHEASETNIDDIFSSKGKTSTNKLNPRNAQKVFKKNQKAVFQENEIRVERISQEVQFNKEINGNTKPNSYQVHYNPFERYWLYLQMNIDIINKTAFDTYFNKHVGTFKLICSECARIIEQTPEEFMYEFQFSELFLVYSGSYSETRKWRKKQKLDTDLRYYVNQAVTHW